MTGTIGTGQIGSGTIGSRGAVAGGIVDSAAIAFSAESALSGAGSLNIAGVSAALSGDSSLAGAGTVVLAGGGVFSAQSDFAGAGSKLVGPTDPISLSAESDLAGAGTLLVYGGWPFSAASDWTGVGEIDEVARSTYGVLPRPTGTKRVSLVGEAGPARPTGTRPRIESARRQP